MKSHAIAHKPTSTKTRIKTGITTNNNCKGKKLTNQLPLKQGLRQLHGILLHAAKLKLTNQLPLKQGLRQECLVIFPPLR